MNRKMISFGTLDAASQLGLWNVFFRHEASVTRVTRAYQFLILPNGLLIEKQAYNITQIAEQIDIFTCGMVCKQVA